MDLYKTVTDRIIEQLEQGYIPWEKPWMVSGSAISHATGKPYSFLNQMLLGRPGEYVTFKQCQQEGGKIRKGEKASMIVFWKWLSVIDEETQEEKNIPFLNYYRVFHITQCEGLQSRYAIPVENDIIPDQTADDIIAAYCSSSGVKIVHEEGDRAFYHPSSDTVVLPHRKQFTQTAEYYGTAFHELVHSTGHENRLDRLHQTAFFGTTAYSKEELIAEVGSAALLNMSGLETASSFRNNVGYIESWLQVLRNDKRFIVSAATKAEKAVNLILGEQV